MATWKLSVIPATLLIIATLNSLKTYAEEATAYSQDDYPASYFSHWQPNNALDMMLRLPGVSLQQDSEGQFLLQLHGMGNRYLAILVDGHPLSGSNINNTRSTRQIPASLISRIEVTRSGRADLDSRGGAAGTINLVLKQQQPQGHQLRLYSAGEPLNSAAAIKGSLGTPQQNWNYALDWQKARSSIRAEETRQNGDSATIRDHWNSQRHDDSSSYYLGFNQQNPESQFHTSLLYLKNQEVERNSDRNSNRKSDLIAGNEPQDNLRNQQSRQKTARLNTQYQTDWLHMRWKTNLMLESFSEKEKLSNSAINHSDERWLLTSSLEEVVDEHHWQSGINVRQMQRKVSSDNLSGNAQQTSALNFNVREDSFHWFGLDRWQLTYSTQFEAGFRMETYTLRQTDRLSTGRSESTGDTYWLPSVHLKHQYNDRVQLQFSGHQSVRQPELANRIPFRLRLGDSEFRGNGNLDAELVSAVEFTFQYLHPSNNDKLRLNLFQRTINNAILLVSRQEQENDKLLNIIEPQNSDVSGSLQGIEADGETSINSQLSLHVAAGWYHSRMRATGSQKSQQLAHQPQFSLQAGLRGRWSDWRYGAHWRFQGKSEELQNNLSQAAITTTSQVGQQLSLYINRQWQQWCVSFGVQQLLDDNSVVKSSDSKLSYHRKPLWQGQLKWSF